MGFFDSLKKVANVIDDIMEEGKKVQASSTNTTSHSYQSAPSVQILNTTFNANASTDSRPVIAESVFLNDDYDNMIVNYHFNINKDFHLRKGDDLEFAYVYTTKEEYNYEDDSSVEFEDTDPHIALGELDRVRKAIINYENGTPFPNYINKVEILQNSPYKYRITASIFENDTVVAYTLPADMDKNGYYFLYLDYKRQFNGSALAQKMENCLDEVAATLTLTSEHR